jgi:hypothetical protein
MAGIRDPVEALDHGGRGLDVDLLVAPGGVAPPGPPVWGLLLGLGIGIRLPARKPVVLGHLFEGRGPDRRCGGGRRLRFEVGKIGEGIGAAGVHATLTASAGPGRVPVSWRNKSTISSTKALALAMALSMFATSLGLS